MTTQQTYTAEQSILDAMIVCAMPMIGDKSRKVFETTHQIAKNVFADMTAGEADDVAKNVTTRFGI